jgi:Fur family transcriptional regulator, ferric uptake regulator
MEQVTEIFHRNDLVRTSCREEIIQIIVSSVTPLSEEEIKQRVNINFDRTTFYRTFKTLLAKEILRKIVIDSTVVKYALTADYPENYLHAHFYCIKCSKVICVPQEDWSYSNLPAMYKATGAELLIKGYCENCK